MISYIVGLVAILVIFSDPIGELLFPGRQQHLRRPHLAPRPQLNESLLAIDPPGAEAPTCAPDAYTARILHRDPLVVYLEGFVSDEERRHLLEVSEPLFAPSTITHDGNATHRDTSVRDSEVAVLPRDNAVRCIERRALALQGWPEDLFIERLRTQRYGPGGHYGYHFDWTANRAGWGRVSSIMAWVEGGDVRGGGTKFPLVQRMDGDGEWCDFVECRDKTEEKQEGGETEGEEKQSEAEAEAEAEEGVTFKVVPGNAVYWENFAPDGRGYEETWHAGLAVDEGTKVGLNIWSFGRIR